jgi:uncharacterized protein
MGRLWIDVLTPKQALFTKSLVESAPRSIQCIVTTRNYSELNKFISQIGLKHQSIGMHGGGELIEKLRASIQRQQLLIPFVSENSIDFSLSFISPEAARVSFGLGMRHFICSDSPHATAPCRLAVPLCDSLYTPFPIRKARWTQYGLAPNQVTSYHALDPWAWISRARLGKITSRVHGRVMIRLEEWFASYFKKGKGVSSVLARLVHGIKGIGDFEITLVPRYDDQRGWAKEQFGNDCIVPDSTIDGLEEISKTDLLIGGGATMTQEAALLGIPNISYFPSANLDVFTNYYFPKRLSMKAATSKELMNTTFSILKKIDIEKESFAERARKETSKFEDPVAFVFEHLGKFIPS